MVNHYTKDAYETTNGKFSEFSFVGKHETTISGTFLGLLDSRATPGLCELYIHDWVVIFTPIPGEMVLNLMSMFFSNGWLKPPTR